MTTVTLETLEDLCLRMTIRQPIEPVRKEINARIKALTWCPLSAEQERDPSVVKRYIIASVIQSSFFEALSRNDLVLAGEPRYGQEKDRDGELIFSIEFETLPRIDTSSLGEISVLHPDVAITDQDIHRFIVGLRSNLTDNTTPLTGPLPEHLVIILNNTSNDNDPRLGPAVKTYMEGLAAMRTRQIMTQNLLKAILEKSPFTPPSILVNKEFQTRMTRHNQRKREHPETPIPDPQQVKNNSAVAVANTLAIQSIIRSQNITAMPEDVRNAVEKIAASHHNPQSIIDQHYKNQDMLISVAESVMREKAIDFILTKVRINDAKATFSQIVPA